MKFDELMDNYPRTPENKAVSEDAPVHMHYISLCINNKDAKAVEELMYDLVAESEKKGFMVDFWSEHEENTIRDWLQDAQLALHAAAEMIVDRVRTWLKSKI